jgi:hypothetical protein
MFAPPAPGPLGVSMGLSALAAYIVVILAAMPLDGKKAAA